MGSDVGQRGITCSYDVVKACHAARPLPARLVPISAEVGAVSEDAVALAYECIRLDVVVVAVSVVDLIGACAHVLVASVVADEVHNAFGG